MDRGHSGGLPPLGELERAVLEYLWSVPEADVLQTHGAMGREISPNTVGSALERLHRKGLARRRKVSHAYRYRAALDRETFTARRAVEAAGGVQALAAEGVLAAFLDEMADGDDAILDQLEQLIAKRRGGDW